MWSLFQSSFPADWVLATNFSSSMISNPALKATLSGEKSSRSYKLENMNLTKLLFAFVAFLWISSPLQAQNNLVGTTWHYLVYESNSDSAFGQKIEAIKDTVYQSKNCLMLKNLSQYLPAEPNITVPEFCYLAKEGSKTYLYDFNRNAFSLLMDSNWVVGDTFVFEWGSKTDSFIVQIANNTQTGVPNTLSYRIQHLEEDSLGWYSYLLYPAGYNYGFIPVQNPADNSMSSDNLFPKDSLTIMLCFDNKNGVAFDKTAFGCDTRFWVGVKSFEESKLALYPNPAHHEFYIKMEDQSIQSVEIIHLSGRIIPVNFDSETGQCHLDEMCPGMYLVRVKTMEGNSYFSRIAIVQ